MALGMALMDLGLFLTAHTTRQFPRARKRNKSLHTWHKMIFFAGQGSEPGILKVQSSGEFKHLDTSKPAEPRQSSAQPVNSPAWLALGAQ